MMARWWLVEQQQIFTTVTYLLTGWLTYQGTLRNTYGVNKYKIFSKLKCQTQPRDWIWTEKQKLKTRNWKRIKQEKGNEMFFFCWKLVGTHFINIWYPGSLVPAVPHPHLPHSVLQPRRSININTTLDSPYQH